MLRPDFAQQFLRAVARIDNGALQAGFVIYQIAVGGYITNAELLDFHTVSSIVFVHKLVGIHENGHRPVVEQLHFHIGAERTGLCLNTQSAAARYKIFI